MRPSPPLALQAALANCQNDVSATNDVDAVWRKFQRSEHYDLCRQVLAEIAGPRVRCFYCSDSLGGEVEHYWPKVKYPGQAFVFANLMLICGPCNRKKGARFPLDSQGRPLLLDPTFDDPWDALFFIESTGLLAPRIYPGRQANTFQASQRGITTQEILGTVLNRDAVCLGRIEGWEDVSKIVEEYCLNPANHLAALDSLRRKDTYGLTDWMLRREGAEVERIRDLRHQYPEAWRVLRDSYQTGEPTD